MEAEFWRYGSLARRQFIRNLCETSSCEHLVVGNLAFLQVSLCGFIGIRKPGSLRGSVLLLVRNGQ
jgi:hypothetical protein